MRRLFPWIALFLLLLIGAPRSQNALPVGAIAYSWDSNTTVANATIPLLNPAWAGGGTITSVTYYTNGSGSPSFSLAIKIGGTNVTSCNGITVSSGTAATTTCTGANTFTNSSQITAVITSASGTPNQALVQVNFTSTLY